MDVKPVLMYFANGQRSAVQSDVSFFVNVFHHVFRCFKSYIEAFTNFGGRRDLAQPHDVPGQQMTS